MYTEGGGASYTPSSNKNPFQSSSSSRVLFTEYWTIPLGRMRQRNAHTSGKENVGRKENPLSRRNTSVIGSKRCVLFQVYTEDRAWAKSNGLFIDSSLMGRMIGHRNNSTFDWIIMIDRRKARFLRIDFPRSVSIKIEIPVGEFFEVIRIPDEAK